MAGSPFGSTVPSVRHRDSRRGHAGASAPSPRSFDELSRDVLTIIDASTILLCIDERRCIEGMVPMGAGQQMAAGSSSVESAAGSAGASASLPVVVIGGGPVGLAAAANLLERGLEPLVLEAGDRVGSAVSEWGHVSLFSPWAYTVDAAAGRLLDRTGWTRPDPDALPTGRDLVERYLAPLAATPELAGRIRTGTPVVAVTRQGVDKTRTVGRDGRPYLVRTLTADGVSDIAAAAVIDASGT